MKVIKSGAITPAMLVGSTVAEPSGADPAVWAAPTAYSVGDLAYRASTHRIYKRLVAGTTATAPESDLTGAAANWADYGPTNRWAMFDQEVNTQSTVASPLTVVLDPGLVNSLALIELVGTQAEISITDGAAGPTVYSQTISLEQSSVADWYAYFFEPFSQRATVVLTDLPPYSAARVTVTITGAGTVKCGGLIFGTVYSLGGTLYGVTAGIRDYSKKTTDETTGVVSLVVGKFAKRLRARLQIAAGAVNVTQQLLTDLRATPAVWIGDDSGVYDALIVFGFYRDFSLDVAYPGVSYYSLEIEGMT